MSEIRQIGKYFNTSGEAHSAAPGQATTVDAATNTVATKALKPKPKRNKAKENLRTTLMLTIVCVLFLITEFPQSILMSLSIIKGQEFYANVYMPLGDLLDMLALINNSINFLLYCTMSRAFRNTFYNVMVNLWCCKAFKRYCLSENSKFMCRSRKPNINSTNFSLFSGTTLGLNNNNIVTNGSKSRPNSNIVLNVKFAAGSNNDNHVVQLAKEEVNDERTSLVGSVKEAPAISKPVVDFEIANQDDSKVNNDNTDEKKALIVTVTDCEDNCVFSSAGNTSQGAKIVDVRVLEADEYEAVYSDYHDEEDEVDDENQI